MQHDTLPQGATAILQKPLEEIRPRGRRKAKGTTTICQCSLPYDREISDFFGIPFAIPIRVPAGALLELRLTLPSTRQRR